MSAGESRKAVLAALAANAGIAVAKLIAFVITGSGAMLAESAHSIADSGNQGLLLFGAMRAKREPDSQHPFGHTRERYFAAFIVAIVLFTGGAGFSFREGYHKATHPEPLQSPAVAILVLIVAIALETFSFRTAIKAAEPMRGDRGWWRFIRENKTAELTVVLLEDAAALIGLVFALAGVSLAATTHEPVWDAVGTFAIAGLLAGIAVVLAIETKSLLIGEAATSEELGRIRSALAASFENIVHLRTEHRGPDEMLVAAKVAVPGSLPASDLARQIDEAEARIRAVVPSARYIFIEPDVVHGSH
jgi:cation diffusion facilitator family transporter